MLVCFQMRWSFSCFVSFFCLFSCRPERNLGRWRDPRRTPDRDKTTLKYQKKIKHRLKPKFFPYEGQVTDSFPPLTENDRGADQQTGEADPGGSAAHHPASSRAGPLWGLGGQNGTDGSLADADHTHRQVRPRWRVTPRTFEAFVNRVGSFLFTQGESRSSVSSGDPKRSAAGDPGPAAGAEGSLPHDDAAAHHRGWALLLRMFVFKHGDLQSSVDESVLRPKPDVFSFTCGHLEKSDWFSLKSSHIPPLLLTLIYTSTHTSVVCVENHISYYVWGFFSRELVFILFFVVWRLEEFI